MPKGKEERELREKQMMVLARDALEWVFASRRGDTRGMKRNANQIADNIHGTLRMHIPLKRA